jgi:DNA-binding IclR family transcriptional regulator
MHAVSSGQVFLAYMPAPSLARLLATPREAFTDRTITEAGALLERLRTVRTEGYAWVREEYAEGITSIAAPVAAADGEIAAAVHVHGPTYRFPVAGSEARLAAAVVAAASEIRNRLRGG